MPVRSITRWLLATMHRPVRRRSINVVVPMVIPSLPTMFERRSANTRNESIKINATNRHIQRLVIAHSFRGPGIRLRDIFVSIISETLNLLFVGPTADAMVSSDEEEQAANNNTNSNSSNNHLRHETEDDGLFPFRRSNANQYHRVCLLPLCSIA